MNDAVVLFSGGAGAWELGAEWAGVRVVVSCEKEAIRREFLRANFGDDHIVFDDVETLTGERVRSALAVSGDWRPRLLLASPPCQDASVANHAGRGLDGERTGLFRQAVRLVHELRPDGVAFENVAGLTPRECHAILEWLGTSYRGWVHRVGDEDVGAPQRAWRRIICAVRIAATEEEPLRRIGLARDAAPVGLQFAEADEEPIRIEHGRRRDGAGAAVHAAHPAPEAEEVALLRPAGDDRSLARSEIPRGDDRRFDPGDWRDNAGEALCGRLRVANGIPAGLAVSVQEAYGDAFPPLLAQCVIEALLDTLGAHLP